MKRQYLEKHILYWNTGLTIKTIAKVKQVLEVLKPDLIFLSDFIGLKTDRSSSLKSLCPTGYKAIIPEDFDNIKAGDRPICLVHQQAVIIEPNRDYLNLPSQNFAVFDWNWLGTIFRLIPVHFLSTAFNTNKSQQRERLREDVIRLKSFIDPNIRCYIFGDFNLNPWDEVMISSFYLNSRPYREPRKMSSAEMNFMLYNPSWNLLGDYTTIEKPTGSYTQSQPNSDEMGNVLPDQLLMNYRAIGYFNAETFKLIDSIPFGKKKTPLWSYALKKPNAKYSDHLPLFFSLRIKI